jgi:hypothetical protein
MASGVIPGVEYCGAGVLYDSTLISLETALYAIHSSACNHGFRKSNTFIKCSHGSTFNLLS